MVISLKRTNRCKVFRTSSVFILQYLFTLYDFVMNFGGDFQMMFRSWMNNFYVCTWFLICCILFAFILILETQLSNFLLSIRSIFGCFLRELFYVTLHGFALFLEICHQWCTENGRLYGCNRIIYLIRKPPLPSPIGGLLNIFTETRITQMKTYRHRFITY